MHVDLPEKRYYSIGEVAEAFQVKPSLQPKKKESGTRKYTQENVKTIQYIHHLVKEKGMTLEGAKKQLLLKPNDDKKESILSKLESIKDSLEKLKIKL